MKNIILLTLLLISVGCGNGGGYKAMLLQNRANLLNLKVGMTKEQVLKTMDRNQDANRNNKITNPQKSDMMTKGDDNYEIIYFMTKRNPPFTPIAYYQATPLVLKNDKLSGWGKQAVKSIGK